MSNERIEQARRIFLGSRLWQFLDDIEDNAPVRIVVSVKNGYAINLTLGDLRALRSELEANDTTELLQACEAAHELINRLEDEWMHTHPVGQQLRATIAKYRGQHE